MAATETGRYGVTRHHDKRGTWYLVIDRQAATADNAVYATRSQSMAHAEADRRNHGAAS